MLVPEFYERFQCKAGACQHSCCRGWEIDIDEETADRYLRMPGERGQMLRSHIENEDGIWHFSLTPEGDCPFLQADGLCKLIHTVGEDILCIICREHPRFYKQVQGQEIAGVGLSCEKSVELLLAEEGPLLFCQAYAEQAGGPEPDRFAFAALLDKLGIAHTSELCHWQACLDTDYIAFVLETLAMTEPIE